MGLEVFDAAAEVAVELLLVLEGGSFEDLVAVAAGSIVFVRPYIFLDLDVAKLHELLLGQDELNVEEVDLLLALLLDALHPF